MEMLPLTQKSDDNDNQQRKMNVSKLARSLYYALPAIFDEKTGSENKNNTIEFEISLEYKPKDKNEEPITSISDAHHHHKKPIFDSDISKGIKSSDFHKIYLCLLSCFAKRSDSRVSLNDRILEGVNVVGHTAWYQYADSSFDQKDSNFVNKVHKLRFSPTSFIPHQIILSDDIWLCEKSMNEFPLNFRFKEITDSRRTSSSLLAARLWSLLPRSEWIDQNFSDAIALRELREFYFIDSLLKKRDDLIEESKFEEINGSSTLPSSSTFTKRQPSSSNEITPDNARENSSTSTSAVTHSTVTIRRYKKTFNSFKLSHNVDNKMDHSVCIQKGKVMQPFSMNTVSEKYHSRFTLNTEIKISAETEVDFRISPFTRLRMDYMVETSNKLERKRYKSLPFEVSNARSKHSSSKNSSSSTKRTASRHKQQKDSHHGDETKSGSLSPMSISDDENEQSPKVDVINDSDKVRTVPNSLSLVNEQLDGFFYNEKYIPVVFIKSEHFKSMPFTTCKCKKTFFISMGDEDGPSWKIDLSVNWRAVGASLKDLMITSDKYLCIMNNIHTMNTIPDGMIEWEEMLDGLHKNPSNISSYEELKSLMKDNIYIPSYSIEIECIDILRQIKNNKGNVYQTAQYLIDTSEVISSFILKSIHVC